MLAYTGAAYNGDNEDDKDNPSTAITAASNEVSYSVLSAL